MRRLTLRLFIVASLAMFLLLPLTSAATSETINYTENFVDATSNLHDPANKGTNSSFTAMQAYDQTNNTLTEENTGGGGGVNEYRFVDTCPALVLWSSTGTTPFLDAVDASNIYTSGTTAWSVWIEFAATSGSGTGFTVNMSAYLDNTDADELVGWELDWTGDSVADASGSWTPTATPSWWDSGTITGLDTQTEIDACTIRYETTKGTGGPGTTTIDASRLGISQAGGVNYELDLEYQWTAADYDETIEKLCIFAGPRDAEALKVDIWTGTWTNIIADLTYDVWNNVSISSYLTDATVEIRFLGGTETGDTTQDTWEIDAVLIQTYSTAYTEVRYEGITTDETDYTSRGVSKSLFESITVDETDTRISLFSKILHESITVDETIYFVHDAVRVLFESVTTDETISTAAAIISILFESVALAATGYFNKIIQKFLFESIGAGVSVGFAMNFSRQFAEGITASPTLYNGASIVRSFSEGITIDETCTPQSGAGLTELYLFETITINETDTLNSTIGLFLYDSITVNETPTTTLDASISLFESITINETITNTFTGEWILHLNESFDYGENDVWGPYRPVIPEGEGGPGYLPKPKPKPTIPTWLIPGVPDWILLVGGAAALGIFYVVSKVQENKEEEFYAAWDKAVDWFKKPLDRLVKFLEELFE